MLSVIQSTLFALPASAAVPVANFVYGQSGSFTSSSQGTSSTKIAFSFSIVIDSVDHRMFLADSANNRVLVYLLDSANDPTNDTADFVLGQCNSFSASTAAAGAGGMSDPEALAYDFANKRLWVGDAGNNRVLGFNATPGTLSNTSTASYVLGQTNFTNTGASTAANGMTYPQSMAYDGVAKTLYVGEYTGRRTTVWDLSGTITSGAMSASFVIGQSGFAAASSTAGQNGRGQIEGIEYDPTSKFLYVSELDFNRVLVYDMSSVATNMNASYVLGQTSYTNTSSSVAQNRLNGPASLDAKSTKWLYVTDNFSNRVVAFDKTALANGMNATNLYGQR